MNKQTDITVIGGGAAGLMAAATAAGCGASVTVAEKMPRPARKLMITGKGRCNLTNNTDAAGLIAATLENPKFMFSAYNAFPPSATMQFFENAGVPLKTERGKRVFPVSDKAVDIVDALVNTAKSRGVEFIFSAVEKIEEGGGNYTVFLKDGSTLRSSRVIIATGGKSYPLTGSTGDGYRFAAELGHKIIDTAPSLVSLVAFDNCCGELEGLSLKNVGVTVTEEGAKKPCFTDFGDMMFTSFGISGPLTLSASAHMRRLPQSRYRFTIDLKPALSPEKLDLRLRRDLAEFSGKDIINSLDKLLPKRLIPVIVRRSGIFPHTRSAQLTQKQRTSLVAALKNFTIEIISAAPIDGAIVTRGGVSTAQISPSTMESKIKKGLYFAGEVIDVDAYTGGFNLQIAFSTGYLAGKSAAAADFGR